jgi:hypothetical protein
MSFDGEVTFLDYVGEMSTINCGGETLLWKKTLMVQHMKLM